MEEKLKSIKEKRKLQDVVTRLRQFDSQCKLYTIYWKTAYVPQEIIDLRMEVAKGIFEEDCTKTHEELKQKYTGLNLSRFEKKLAREVIAKAGIDTEYQKNLEYLEFVKKVNEKRAKEFVLPDEVKPENPEIKSKEDIKKFIKDRVTAFYARKFNYPDDAAAEEPIETIGL